ncbi:DUF5133 domain-containing protein [Streptomyces sp. NPDC056492]|uniref:DUF5133 domain-containing protein n=1 Tax=unclassified Streptomyces TaxID=2593676 RepID=UPI0036946243
MARAVVSLRDDVCAPPGDDRGEQAVRAEIERARATVLAPPAAAAALFPSAFVLRQHVSQVRAARRRTLAAPHDAVQRAELENGLYTLCVLPSAAARTRRWQLLRRTWRRTGSRAPAPRPLPDKRSTEPSETRRRRSRPSLSSDAHCGCAHGSRSFDDE